MLNTIAMNEWPGSTRKDTDNTQAPPVSPIEWIAANSEIFFTKSWRPLPRNFGYWENAFIRQEMSASLI